jgi:hypothetical protein
MLSLPNPLELYMELDGGERLERIIMTPGAEPSFTCLPYCSKFPTAASLTKSELMAFYRKNVPRKTVNDQEKVNIWTTLFVAKGFMKGYSMEYVFANCIPSQFGKVGLECPAANTRSKTVKIVKPKAYRKGDCSSFAFESDENKIILPSVKDEEDYSDMPALITVEHSKALGTLEAKELALKKEAAELDRLEVKLKEVQALYEAVGQRRRIWCLKEMADGEKGLDRLLLDYKEEALELDALEAKLAAFHALKATVITRRETLIAAVDGL